MMAKDLGERGNSGVLFRNGTMDFLGGWLLGYAQQGGLSPGSLLTAFSQIRDGDPESWVAVFTRVARAAATRAEVAERADSPTAAALDWLAACVAWRAAIGMIAPSDPRARAGGEEVSASFRKFVKARRVPLEPWQVDFGGARLPAYVSSGVERADRLVIVIGGGDTCVEDLWFFGGGALVAADWPVLLVDLPGQGATPYQGLHFGAATQDALQRTFEAVRERGFTGETVLLGWSGGGMFVTKYASIASAADRLRAVVASAPMADIGEAMRKAFPAILRRPSTSPVVRAVLALARRNKVLALSLAKYQWQFGAEIGGVLQRFEELGRVDLEAIDVPILGLLGLGEAGESRRQAEQVITAVSRRHPQSRLVAFDADSGGAAHCQVGNLPLAMAVTLQWLDDVLARS
jgi:pimeloyl-ACP methyl ester carboxylesterase